MCDTFAYFNYASSQKWRSKCFPVRNSGGNRKRSPVCDGSDDDSDVEAGGGGDYKDDTNNYNTRNNPSLSPSSTSSLNNGISMAAPPAVDVVFSLRQCDDIECIGIGRMGIILRCSYAGQRIAIKLVDVNKGDLTALYREKSMQRKLQSVQGILIPKVVHYNCEVRENDWISCFSSYCSFLN